MRDHAKPTEIELTHACNLGPAGKVMTMPRHRAELAIKRGVARLVEPEPKVRNKAIGKPAVAIGG